MSSRICFDRRAAVAVTAVAALLALLPVGCGFKIEKMDPRTDVEVGARGFESPQAAYAWLSKATEEDDFVGIAQSITDETAHTFAGVLVHQGMRFKASGSPGLEINRALGKHGLNDTALADLSKDFSASLKDAAAVSSLADSIENKRLFIADMLRALNTLSRPTPINDFPTDLAQLQMNGSDAIGLIDRAGKLERIAFRKTDVGWQVRFEVREAPENRVEATPHAADDAAGAAPALSGEAP